MIVHYTRRAILVLGLPIVLIVAWWLATSSGSNPFWPPLSQILQVFPSTWFEGRMGSDVVPSLLRLTAGYSLALVSGVALGTVIGSSKGLRDSCEPVLEFLRAIPPPVLVPLIMIFFGIGNLMKVSVIAFGCVWPILLNTVEGVREVDQVLRDTGRTYRLSRLTTLRSLVLRGASPRIMAGARQSLSIGIILMVISEMVAASNGIGFTLIQFQRTFDLPQMWTGIIVLGVLGVILSALFRIVERRVLAWYLGIRAIQKKG